MDKPLNKYIDHTLLKPTATKEQIAKLCQEAIRFDFATVCVNPYYVKEAVKLLRESDVGVTTVIGFPLGATSRTAKVTETAQAIQDGATEIDVVINIGAVLDGNFAYVYDELKAIREIASKKVLKVILETCYLTDEQIVKVCRAATKAKADFVKTSTGFGLEGATIANVKLMKKTVGIKAMVKASGGIKNLKDAEAMIKAGADRLGTSGGVAIMLGKENENTY